MKARFIDTLSCRHPVCSRLKVGIKLLAHSSAVQRQPHAPLGLQSALHLANSGSSWTRHFFSASLNLASEAKFKPSPEAVDSTASGLRTGPMPIAGAQRLKRSPTGSALLYSWSEGPAWASKAPCCMYWLFAGWPAVGQRHQIGNCHRQPCLKGPCSSTRLPLQGATASCTIGFKAISDWPTCCTCV